MTGAPADARAWLDHLLEPGWTPLFEDVLGGDPLGFPGYAEQLERARERTGSSEAVLVGEGTLAEGPAAVVVAFEFGFLGGSMGQAAGERIVRAFEHAAARGLPLVALTASGGARMQEGMGSLAQMPATVAARRAFAGSGKPFVAYLRNPTTGGVFASFASTADVLVAEPGATIGFAGPRVAEALGGEPLPDGSHTAEAARDAGVIDDILAPSDLSSALAALGRLEPVTPPPRERPTEPAPTDAQALAIVEGARGGARAAIDWFPGAFRLRASTAALGLRIAHVEDAPAVVIEARGGAMLTPASYRDARHAVALAERLRLPIVTVVNTPGADPRAPSESGGIAREIALTFDAMVGASVPTVALVTGAGSSGGALALAASDRVLIAEGAFFSVIAPEGAASILRRDDVGGVATDLRLTAHDLRARGLADLVVAEPRGGAPADPDAARALAHDAIAWALAELGGEPSSDRTDRWRLR